MPQVNYAEDIVPLSSFRADVTRLMSQTRQTHRPVIVTQNGRAANVFLDVADYQKLIDRVDLMMDIYKGEKDITAGRVHSTDDVRNAVAAELGKEIEIKRKIMIGNPVAGGSRRSFQGMKTKLVN